MAKKATTPPPQAGDYVKLRGREPRGYLMAVREEVPFFAYVWWDWYSERPDFDWNVGPYRREAPKIVHRDELEIVQ